MKNKKKVNFKAMLNILSEHGCDLMPAPLGKGYYAGKNMLVCGDDLDEDALEEDLEKAGMSWDALNLYDPDDKETYKSELKV
jgi:hypothetical protein